MNEQERLESIASMMEAVRTVKDAEYAIIAGRDMLLQWSTGGTILADITIDAWMDWVSQQNGCMSGGTMELRHEHYVPAIPM